MSKDTGYYQLKLDWMDTGAYLYQEGANPPEGAPWKWNRIFVSPVMLAELESDAYKRRVLDAVADDPGGVTIGIEDNGENGDGIYLSLSLPESAAVNEHGNKELMHVKLPDASARILAEALQTILKLRDKA